MRAYPRDRSSLQPILDDVTNHVLDREVQLLNARRVTRGDDQADVSDVLQLPASLPHERDHGHAARLCGLRRANHIGTLARGRMQDQHIAGLGERFYLSREDLIEAHVVRACGEQRRVGCERDSPHRGAIGLVADDVLGRDMLRVGRAAAVAGKVQRAAVAQRLLVAIGDRGDVVRLLRGHATRERRKAVQRLPDSLVTAAQRVASTNASSPPSPPRLPSSPCGPASTTVPITTKSAPACRAARACAGVRMPPPTKSGRWATAARHARITSPDTGRSAPLPASRYSACIPINVAAVARAAASSGLSAGSGRVWVTDSTLVT